MTVQYFKNKYLVFIELDLKADKLAKFSCLIFEFLDVHFDPLGQVTILISLLKNCNFCNHCIFLIEYRTILSALMVSAFHLIHSRDIVFNEMFSSAISLPFVCQNCILYECYNFGRVMQTHVLFKKNHLIPNGHLQHPHNGVSCMLSALY